MALQKEEVAALMEGISEKIGDNEEIMANLREIQESYEETFDDLAQEKENNKNLKTQYRKRFFSSGKSIVKKKEPEEEEYQEDFEDTKTLEEFFKTVKR